MGGLIGFLILALDGFVIFRVLRGDLSEGKKLLWIILVLLFPVAGAIAYYLISKKKMI